MSGRVLTAIVISLSAGLAVWLAVWRIPETWEKAVLRFRRLADHRRACVFAAAFAGPVLRLLLLGVAPPPEPTAHDDFVHLLAADTLLHGRLANPPHPLSVHFETIYVLQRPSYASKYPLGQALFLALGKVLTGRYWGGVWISMAFFCGALAWLLYRCMAPSWALLGGLYASLYLGVGSYWMNSYWGGAVAGAGGALALGALDAWRRSRRLRWGVLISAGWSIVWLARPYESLFLALLLAAAVLCASWREGSVQAAARLFAILAIAAAPSLLLTVMHNRAVTGNALEMPYQLSRKQYGVPAAFLWQPPPPQPPGLNTRQLEMYRWQVDLHQRASTSISYNAGRFETVWRFYVGWGLTIPILLAVLGRSRAEIGPPLAILAGASAWSFLYPTMPPHYLAPYAGVFLLLAMQGCRLTATLTVKGFPIGCFIVAAGLAWSVGLSAATWLTRGADRQTRARLVEELNSQRGDDLVFVRYSPSHNVHDREWVYNEADIDSSRIVWANDLSPAANSRLIQYYAGRKVWLVEPDKGLTLRRYYEDPPEH